MRAILDRVQTIARSDTSVLLVGETGVGKELFADYIHRTSPRRDRPFVKIALSAMPHDLLESEVFGHERGAFTNAVAEKRGLFEVAHTGTFFLDDIDDVAPGVQVKLLRVLELQQVMRVGGTAPIAVDVRLITASKIDLEQLGARNLFRADLYYRINVCPVRIPPLRERREDVPLLAEHFLRRFAPHKALALTPEAEGRCATMTGPATSASCATSCSRLRCSPRARSSARTCRRRSPATGTSSVSCERAAAASSTAGCRTRMWSPAWRRTCCGKPLPMPAATAPMPPGRWA